MTEQTDYEKYRGKCFEYSTELVKQNPTFTLVRGHYDCPIWGKQQHWWCVDPTGKIHDPTVKQFPSNGLGEYIPLPDIIPCMECGKMTHIDEGQGEGSYFLCSSECYGRMVGVFVSPKKLR